MARSVRPIRLLRRSVGFAVKGVKRGVGGAVRLAWPRNCRRRSNEVDSDGGEPEARLSRRKRGRKLRTTDFPTALCQQEGAGSKKCQALMTVGSRTWGNWWDGRGLLNVKIYDFAIYADKKQTQNSQLSKYIKRKGLSALQPSFFRDLRSSPDIDMSLVVKASRNLPIRIMKGEYKRILRRRLEMVGGTSADPALGELITMFEESSLPDNVRERGNVKAGSVLTFRRSGNGLLTAEAGGHDLGSVKSSTLCAALFDLYLGSNPVSKSAQTLAGEKVVEFVLENRKEPVGRFSPAAILESRNETNCKNTYCLVA